MWLGVLVRAFSDILETAVLHKGSLAKIEASLPKPASAKTLSSQSNAFYLSNMSRRVFQAGLKHSMVNDRWPAFEKALRQFDPMECAMLSDSDIDDLMSNQELIRHLGKMKSIRLNAAMIIDISRQYGSFGQFLAQRPEDNIVGLWLELKKIGAQLGGMSGSRFLRMVGKDTFLLTNDVVAVLKAENIVDKVPSSKRDLNAVQLAFNQWREETGRPLCELSRIISYTVLAETF